LQARLADEAVGCEEPVTLARGDHGPSYCLAFGYALDEEACGKASAKRIVQQRETIVLVRRSRHWSDGDSGRRMDQILGIPSGIRLERTLHGQLTINGAPNIHPQCAFGGSDPAG
jgi:hypothetical protein